MKWNPILVLRNVVLAGVTLSTASAAAQEVRRPTVQTNTTTPAGCTGTGVASTAAPNFYDASGEATSSTVTGVSGINQSAPVKYRQAILSGWQAPSAAYGSIALKVRSACSSETGIAFCRIQYSTNGGSSWNALRSGGNWGATTDSVSLASNQNLSQLQVRYCVEGRYYIDPFTGDPAADLAQLTGYDVRTEGSLTPAAPSNLAANPAPNGLSVSVTWTDNSSTETGFKIDRCTGVGCSNFALQGSVVANATSFPDTAAACTVYNYRAYAFNAQGNSGFSNTVQVSTPCGPSTPGNLTVSSATTTSISLSWTDSTGETGYSLERCSGGGCTNFSPVATPAANATSYTDPSLASNAVYTYRLRATNAVGSSAPSNIVSGLTEQTLSLSTPYVTKYSYDALGNLTKVEQQGAAATCDPNPPNGTCRVRTFEYDSLSQLTKAINPESGQITYTYDDDGNVTSKTSPKPNDQSGSNTVTINFAYDLLHRLTGKTYTNITEPAVTYTFDQGTNGKGRRTSMTDGAGTTSWAYDEMGRPLSEQRTIGAVSKTFQYSYNKDGSTASITYPSGRVITYATSGAGRTLSAVDVTNGVNYATEATYTPAGGLVGMKNGATGSSSGIVTANTYNNRQQPISLTVTNAGGTAVLSLTYNFNHGVSNNGNVMSILNNRDHSRDQTFLYDDINRVKRANTPSTWGLSFGYDAWGNLLSQNQTQGSVPTLSVAATRENRILDYCYDLAGNLVRNNVCPLNPAVVDYTYDVENRLKTAGGETYTYDGDGKRVRKSSGKLYWRGLSNDTLLETDATGANPTEYIFYNGKRTARRDSDSSVHYFFSDHLGSANVVTDALGTMTTCGSVISAEEESDYYPFGGERVVCDRISNQNYKFTGKERDSESGLDYFNARHYSSVVGRFLSVDPVIVSPERKVDPQQLNRYTYVRNNPIRLIDPTGMRLRIALGSGEFGYLCMIAGDFCSRLEVDENGNVSFDTTGLDLSTNEGAAAINDVVQSESLYALSLGSTTETAGGVITVMDLVNLPPAADQVDHRPCKCASPTESPKSGVADQITINPNGVVREYSGEKRVVPLFAQIFHELTEAYAKIDGGQPYTTRQTADVNGGTIVVSKPERGAHEIAVDREITLRNQRPSLKETGRAGAQVIRDPHN